MANDQISLDEYISQLNTRVEDLKINEQINFGQMGITPIEPLTYSSGISNPYYSTVPNVTIGGGSSINASGINVSTPVWTSSGTSAGMTAWQTTSTGGYTIGTPNTQPNLHVGPSGKIHIQGDNADLVIGEKSLRDWMEKVEERLNILTPNPEMEKEWDQLRKLGERYRKLEKKCKEKSDMRNKLKAMPKPEIK